VKSYEFLLSVVALIFLFEGGVNTRMPYHSNGEKQYLNLDKSRLFVSVADTTGIIHGGLMVPLRQRLMLLVSPPSFYQ
jgi:hypothetical protein